MAATYDGLAIAIFSWIPALLFGLYINNNLIWKFFGLSVIVILILPVIAIACSREAGRYTRYQSEELVATIAAYKAAQTGQNKNKFGEKISGGPAANSDGNSTI
jgi:hypothetical protein